MRSDFVTCVCVWEGFKWLGGALETRADLHEPPFQSTWVGCQSGCKWAQGFGARFKCSTRSGIMEICETQEEESEEELRWATSDEDEFKQAAPPRPFEVSRHSPRSHCEQQGESESEECRMATSDEDAPHERVVGRDKAEAPRRHLFRKRGKVYMLTNTVTGKSYVGQTIQRPSARMQQHKGGRQFGYTRSSKPTLIQRSIRKRGWSAFTWEILEKNIAHEPVKILDERERYWIKEKQTLRPNGYNMDEGGQKGKRYTPDMRKAKSKAMMPWARSEKSRARKRELWADPEYREARSKQRKVVQNDPVNVQSRRDTWDAKRDARIQAIADPKEKMRAIREARNNAKQGVRKAIRRGVTGRDLWAEFEERWGNDAQWEEWLQDGERASWMPLVSRSAREEEHA